MAVRFIAVPIDVPDLDESDALSSLPAHRAASGEISLGAFRGLAFALAIEATVAGFFALALVLWHFLR